jgi:hypothetical protein
VIINKAMGREDLQPPPAQVIATERQTLSERIKERLRLWWGQPHGEESGARAGTLFISCASAMLCVTGIIRRPRGAVVLSGSAR